MQTFAIARAVNCKVFLAVLGTVFGLVLARTRWRSPCGFGFGTLLRIVEDSRRAMTFETGLHNTALGLTLVFTFFPEQTGMMLVLGLRGIWHLVSGGLLAWFWSKRPA